MATVPLKVESTKQKGEYTIKTYKTSTLHSMGQGKNLNKIISLLGGVGAPMSMLDEGTVLGYLNGTSKFRVAFEGKQPVAVHIKGTTDEGESFNKKFGKSGVFGSEGSGLDIKGGQTKRNRRNNKRSKLRKLTTRRR